MCAKRVGSRSIDSYIFVHGAVAKRTLSHLGMHGAVVRGTFCFWRMNPLAGIGVSITSNANFLWKLSEASRETLVLEAFSVKFGGSLARNDHSGSFSLKFGGSIARNARFRSLFCEFWKKHRAKRSFWKLLLWNLEEASHETILSEAFSVKIVGSIARKARFGSSFCEIWRKPRTKRSFWKLVPWKVAEASHEMIVLEAFCVKIVRSSAYSSCGLLHKHHYTNTTTPPQEHRHKKTSTRTPPEKDQHKNTTTNTPPQEHHHKNASTKTPPHHHKNTTNARRCSATHMLICTKPETAYSHCVLHFSVALICVFDLCSAFFLVFCILGLHTDTDKRKNLKTYTHTDTQYVFIKYIVKSMSLAGSPPK